MKIDIDKCLTACGNNNKYQYILVVVACLTWFCCDFISIAFPLLFFYPEMECKLKTTGELETCTEKTCCDEKYSGIVPNIIYNNLVTDLDLYCHKNIAKLTIVIFTFGVCLGAFLASRFCDLYGRKFIQLISVITYAIFMGFVCILPYTWTLLPSSFMIGMCASGGTMSAFILCLEVVATERRNLYAILINVAYALAGFFYYLILNYLKSWYFMSALSVLGGLISTLFLFFYFSESPRYFLAANQLKQCLISLLTIAHRNGRRNEYVQYLKEEVLEPEHLVVLGNEFLDKVHFKYNETIQIINSLKISDSKSTTPKSSIRKARSGNSEGDSKKDNIDVLNESGIARQNETIQTKIRETRMSLDVDRADTSLTTSTDSELVVGDGTKIMENLENPGFSALCKYKSVRFNFIIGCLNWFFLTYVYFGNSFDLQKFGSNIFTKGYIIYTAEFVAYLAAGAMMNVSFIGRTRVIGYGGLFGSILSVTYYFFQDHSPWGGLLLFSFRFCVTCIFTVLYTYCMEIYPSSIRSQGLGINLTCARVATIVIAVTIDLYNPYIVFAIICFYLFIIHFTMEETYGKPLMEQIEEITEFKKQNKNNSNLKYNQQTMGTIVDDQNKMNEKLILSEEPKED
jgi:MFS family permease